MVALKSSQTFLLLSWEEAALLVSVPLCSPLPASSNPNTPPPFPHTQTECVLPALDQKTSMSVLLKSVRHMWTGQGKAARGRGGGGGEEEAKEPVTHSGRDKRRRERKKLKAKRSACERREKGRKPRAFLSPRSTSPSSFTFEGSAEMFQRRVGSSNRPTTSSKSFGMSVL